MSTNNKRERLLQAAAAVLQAAPRNELKIVLLNKALFYVDLVALRDMGDTVTHNTYIALEKGPVVAKYPERLVASLESSGIAKQTATDMRSRPVTLITPPQPAPWLNSDLQRSITSVTQHIAGLTSKQASDFSHENPGWRLAWDTSSKTGKPEPINMLIALQQIVDADPWLEQSLTSQEESEIIPSADRSEGEIW